MSKNRNRGTAAHSGVNPQGYSTGAERARDPKTKLENAAKRDNTK
ncbi:small, acid-soluble spore protein L [Peribacillus glennii]|uniref:Small, acid-soluble spore protein L n=1 Tax=Peribacillus glennii TaxID=2303991 RepID=A0A372LHL6_9BACI|nr:small, acid-soluble spore protein L [Peribacillus glennii]RFU65484.1 small, acid-soluble spore protein L [Peribacillus glennii]